MKFKLKKENNYKGNVKTKILKSTLALGLVGTMVFSLAGCQSSNKESIDTGISIVQDYSYEELEDVYAIYYKDKNEVERLSFLNLCSDSECMYVKDFLTGEVIKKVNLLELLRIYYKGKKLPTLKEQNIYVLREIANIEFSDAAYLSQELVGYYGLKADYSTEEVNQVVSSLQAELEQKNNSVTEDTSKGNVKVK